MFRNVTVGRTACADTRAGAGESPWEQFQLGEETTGDIRAEKTAAARELGLARPTLYAKLRIYRI